MFNLFKPKQDKVLYIDTGEGKGSYGEIIEEQKKQDSSREAYSGVVWPTVQNWVTGSYPRFVSGKMDYPQIRLPHLPPRN